mmetsp:Transcript_35590/g.59418  ORF Transcript_35590/g.59418 Transcript_35590/m.59418 type:complete len:114 (+) Transcript_35590:528-869(+)
MERERDREIEKARIQERMESARAILREDERKLAELQGRPQLSLSLEEQQAVQLANSFQLQAENAVNVTELLTRFASDRATTREWMAVQNDQLAKRKLLDQILSHDGMMMPLDG